MKRSPLRRYTPLRRTWFRARERAKHSVPGGEYVFTYRGRNYSLPGRFVVDPVSPDGRRWIASPEARPIITRIVAELADRRCEMKLSPSCWKYAPLGAGHPHHRIHKKMGGAFTDDRIWLQDKRIRVWCCPSCHTNHHNRLHWSQPGWMGAA